MRFILLALALTACTNKAAVYGRHALQGADCEALDTDHGCQNSSIYDVALCTTKDAVYQCSFRTATGGECNKIRNVTPEAP